MRCIGDGNTNHSEQLSKMPAYNGRRSLVGMLALFLLAFSPACAVELRRAPPTGHAQVRDKLKKLFGDVDASVRKSGEDAELVFSTVFTQEQQLATKLVKEVEVMNHTLVQLTDLQIKYRQANKHNAEGDDTRSMPVDSVPTPPKEAEGMLDSAKLLSNLLQTARLGADEKLQLAAPADHVFGSLRRLLAQHRHLAPRFPDVYTAFAGRSGEVRMAPALLQRTVLALNEMESERERDELAQSFLQRGRRVRLQATTASRLGAEAERGVRAEDAERSEELDYSVAFTRAVLQKDTQFLETIREGMGQKAKLVDTIRNSREGQLRALKDLLELLGERPGPAAGAGDEVALPPLAEEVSPTEEAAMPPVEMTPTDVASEKEPSEVEMAIQSSTPGFSFLEVGAEASLQKVLHGISKETHDTIRRNGDTHSILLKIKAALDAAEPVDTVSVQSIVTELGAALRDSQKEESKAAEAKRRCEAQELTASEEKEGLKANVALMTTVQNRTKAAIAAATQSLGGLDSKAKSLRNSLKEFQETATQSLKALEGQAKDRTTIMAAMKKASAVAVHDGRRGPAEVTLLSEVQRELRAQDSAEKAYRALENTMQASLLQYVNSYSQLIDERRSHYESAGTALALYADELDGDAVAQRDSLSTSLELQSEGKELCDSIMAFYEQHNKRRQQLSAILRALLPKVPEIMDAEVSEQDI